MEKTGSKPIDALVAQAMRGDGLAFTALWDTYINQLRSYLHGWMKKLDDMDVDDICSRSFEKAFRQIGSFDPSRSQFFTWLRVIARNTALDLQEQEGRRYPRHQMVSLDDNHPAVADFIPDAMDSPPDSIIRIEDDELNAGYVEHLPELYREIARMRLIDGMQYQEIATALDLPLNTVKTRISRANKLIRQMRRQNEEED